MIPIYSPRTESEAAVIVALMQAYDIPHVMQGGAFSTMYPGPVRTSLNVQTLLVDEAYADIAGELVAPFADQ
ncbi:hypothetical protein ERD78_06520 [Allopusillimonas soli]|uniref:DUF2007 domain-containing protein n=1 Tax=Allopusillimonas soli TaxID=659016 RepID=A0A853F8U7_9BURK|nr:hypothetical protein [Allopusillimonas soli]NYT36523.1 hypothetical protein [Allopusillimonas soli]TEA75024.1 hypothetical protein ERD78_06520 [Allopusillimonas soli]